MVMRRRTCASPLPLPLRPFLRVHNLSVLGLRGNVRKGWEVSRPPTRPDMPKIVGASSRVVDHEGLTIDELAGNVATSNDRISIAHVKVANASSEPWLTLHYDEWMCVLKGRMVLLHGDNQQMEVKTGQTVYIEKGERFRPTFPDAGTEYVPVCLPAFRPDRCIREEEEGGAVSANLAKLHSKPSKTADEQLPEQLYHMCEAAQWEAAKRTGVAYFPPTFEVRAPSATRRNMGRRVGPRSSGGCQLELRGAF